MDKRLSRVIAEAVAEAVAADRRLHDAETVLIDKLVANGILYEYEVDKHYKVFERRYKAALLVKRAAAEGVDPRVYAIRKDDVVGRWTCSVIDEAYGDAELVAELDDAGVRAPMAAVKWARKVHRHWVARYKDVRATAW